MQPAATLLVFLAMPVAILVQEAPLPIVSVVPVVLSSPPTIPA